jgi:hypothetical protein
MRCLGWGLPRLLRLGGEPVVVAQPLDDDPDRRCHDCRRRDHHNDDHDDYDHDDHGRRDCGNDQSLATRRPPYSSGSCVERVDVRLAVSCRLEAVRIQRHYWNGSGGIGRPAEGVRPGVPAAAPPVTWPRDQSDKQKRREPPSIGYSRCKRPLSAATRAVVSIHPAGIAIQVHTSATPSGIHTDSWCRSTIGMRTSNE